MTGTGDTTIAPILHIRRDAGATGTDDVGIGPPPSFSGGDNGTLILLTALMGTSTAVQNAMAQFTEAMQASTEALQNAMADINALLTADADAVTTAAGKVSPTATGGTLQNETDAVTAAQQTYNLDNTKAKNLQQIMGNTPSSIQTVLQNLSSSVSQDNTGSSACVRTIGEQGSMWRAPMAG